MSGGIMLLVGFLVGGAAASAVWAAVFFGKRRAIDAQRAEREQIMASVGEILAEADAIETNFRCGALTHEAFRRSLGDRVNAVMRQLRTNMHVLDPYFVKYAEQEAREYLRVIDNPERRKQQEGSEHPVAAATAVAAVAAAAAPLPTLGSDGDAGEETPDPPETDLMAVVPAAAPPPPQPPSAGDTEDLYELPPAPAAPAAPEAVEVADDFEPSSEVQTEEAADTAADFEPQAEAQAPEAAEAADDFEPHDVLAPDASDDFEPPPAAQTADHHEQPHAAPAPIASEAADTADNFEPPFVPPGMDTANQYEPPHAAPAPIASDRDVSDDFELPPSAPSANDTTGIYNLSPAPVREEELVLGESPEQANAAFAPAPIAPAAPPIPAQTPAPTWGDGESIEEDFEAAFAQFEIPASPPPATHPRADAQHDMLTETNSIDRSAIQSAMPPPQTPQHSEPQGITGDDVVDSIDNFFKLN